MTILDWLKGLFIAPDGDAVEVPAPIDSAREGADEIDPFDPFPDGIRPEITDVFDLHSIAPRDVERVVAEYLLEARRLQFKSVRIIHGKGRGVQRRTVQRILARTPFIRDWTDAPPHSGGWGATVAHLDLIGDKNQPFPLRPPM